MRSTHPITVNIAPLFLRFALAVTFIWAGLGKIVGEMPVSGPQAAALANMGVTIPPAEATQPQPEPTEAEPRTDAPAAMPSGGEASVDPAPLSEAAGMRTVAFIQPDPAQPETTDPDPTSAGDPAADVTSEITEDDAESGTSPDPTTQSFFASDFPGDRMVPRVYGLALLTKSAASPIERADGTTGAPIWPAWAADGNTPVIIAWVAAITELLVGVFLLLGFLSRCNGFTVAVIMGTAMWLTEIGPAIQSGGALYGFLPSGRVWYEPAAWMQLLWQLAILMMGLSLTFSGGGTLALDRALFKRRDDDDEDYDDQDDDS
ncbi:MAG: DoxX family membrane protein [Planctomycetota bacterium]